MTTDLSPTTQSAVVDATLDHPGGPIVLAYSGGLDTSVAIGWLKQSTGRDVVAVAIDCGQGEDMGPIHDRALACGAKDSIVVDAVDEFAAEYCMPAVAANALYMGQYPLVSALSRPLIVKHLAEAAAKHSASAVSHGCTGKGNDQVRFEVGLAALAPELDVIAPARDFAWTRDKAIDWANQHELPIDVSKKSPYSIDQNLWGKAVEAGFLEDPWNAPIEDLYTYTQSPDSGAEPDEVIITFTQGVPTAIDGRPVTPAQAIEQLNQRAGAQGIGRLDMIEDRLIGIKSREVYEAPGAITLITAHQALENLTLDRETARYKAGVDQRWAELAYDGQWFSPLMTALNAFIASTQEHVSGDVRLVLHAGKATVTGRSSSESLYDYGLATYDADDTFDQSQAKGFISLFGMPTKLAAARDRKTAR